MRIIKFLPIVMTIFLLYGCGNVQVNDKTYLRGTSYTEDEFKSLTMSFYEKDSKSIYITGDDFQDISNKTEIVSGKKLFTGHTEIIILGECDYYDALHIFLDEWKVSPSCLIIYGGQFSDKIMENVDVESLVSSVNLAIEQGIIPKSDIVTVLGDLINKKQASLPYLTIDGEYKIKNIKMV